MERPTIVVGVVTKPHGIHGDVTVRNRSDNPDRWKVDSVVFDREGNAYAVVDARRHGTHLLIRFDGIHDRTAAEQLRGKELLVPESWLPTLPDGEWWPSQIEGCRVLTEDGLQLGVVTEVVANPANDLWVAVDDAGNETLIPALADLILEVDVDAKRVVVRSVPGLTAPEHAPGNPA